MIFYVVCESTTYAIKAKKEFENAGIRVLPGEYRGVSGCKRGYTIGVQARDSAELAAVIRRGGIRYKKIVYETSRGVYGELGL